MSTNESAIAGALAALLNPSKIDDFLACAISPKFPSGKHGPKTALLYVRFSEDIPQVAALGEFLWAQCVYYALPRKKRLKFQEAVKADLSVAARIEQAVRNVFIEFNKAFPNRASEVGEVLAYCIVQHHLKAAQVAAKMALKTAANMPVHGLDGIHAVFESDAMTVYFLESKCAASANDGVKEYAESSAAFLANRKQYLREYEIVGDLGHLDSLEGAEREQALDYFDIIGKPTLKRRERFVGVICYSETKHFGNKVPVQDASVQVHETHFAANLSGEFEHHSGAAEKHITAQQGDPAKSVVFFVAVPDVAKLREAFYAASGSLASAQDKATSEEARK